MEREKERMGKRGMKNTFAFYDGSDWHWSRKATVFEACWEYKFVILRQA